MDLTPATAQTYLRHAFDQMLAVADRVGDGLVNTRPLGPTTNAVAALVIHCCELTEFWLGHVALGEPSERDRDAEFSQTATVAELKTRVEVALALAADRLARLEGGEGKDDGGRQFLLDPSDASAVLHVLEELYQHLGHMELAADVLLGPREFRNQNLDNTTFFRTYLRNTTFASVDLTGAKFKSTDFVNVEISGDLRNVIVNGVDIAPLVEAELDQRWPGREKMRADTPGEFRAAWALLEELWATTVQRARALPPDALHESVDGEWSFIQTLRHLGFATAAWVERMVLGTASPWHPLDLPWDEAPGWDGIPWDREARPSLDEVLAIRAQRQATVREVMASLTDAQLASDVTRTEPGWPRVERFPLKQCLRIVLNEEWEHRLYAERDLAKLGALSEA